MHSFKNVYFKSTVAFSMVNKMYLLLFTSAKHKLTEHKKNITAYDIGNPGSDLVQVQNMVTSIGDNWISKAIHKQTIKKSSTDTRPLTFVLLERNCNTKITLYLGIILIKRLDLSVRTQKDSELWVCVCCLISCFWRQHKI